MEKDRKKLTDDFCEVCEQRIKYMKLIDEALEKEDYEAVDEYLKITDELTKKSNELTKKFFDDWDSATRAKENGEKK